MEAKIFNYFSDFNLEISLICVTHLQSFNFMYFEN